MQNASHEYEQNKSETLNKVALKSKGKILSILSHIYVCLINVFYKNCLIERLKKEHCVYCGSSISVLRVNDLDCFQASKYLFGLDFSQTHITSQAELIQCFRLETESSFTMS